MEPATGPARVADEPEPWTRQALWGAAPLQRKRGAWNRSRLEAGGPACVGAAFCVTTKGTADATFSNHETLYRQKSIPWRYNKWRVQMRNRAWHPRIQREGRVMRVLAFVTAALLLVGVQASGSGTSQSGTSHAGAQTAAPQFLKAVNDILYAQPFTLKKGYTNTWSKGHELVSSGVLVVLAVDPALVQPRDALEPILYAGSRPVQRLNHGGQSGRVIGIVPGASDLAGSPIWFGAPGLPERVTAAAARAELARAEKSKIRPFTADKLRSVTHPAVAAADLAALLRDVASTLVSKYSPQEKYLADSWRLPTAKASPKQPR